jgi:tetratricopeptide (TPR) repeat protein
MARLQGDYRQAFALLGQAVTLFRESGDDLRLGFNLCLLGQLAQHLGESASALELHAESLAILRRISHAWGIAMVQSSTGKMLAYQGKLDQARPVVLESLETYQRMGDKTATATVMSIAAMVLFFQGNLDAAMAVEQESLGIRREINRPWGIAYSQISIGRIAFYQGDLDNCVASIREGLATYETIGDLWGIAFGYHCLGMTARRTGDVAASHRLQDALRFREHVGIPAEIAETLEAIALGVEEADPASAVSLIAAAATIRERAGAPVPIVEQPQLTEAAVALRSGLGDAKFKRAYERGRGFSTGEAVAFGLGVGENFKDSRTRA